MQKFIILFCLIVFTASFKAQTEQFKLKTPANNNFLRNDDPIYNKKSTMAVPIAEVFQINAVVWALDRYILNKDYSRISLNTFQTNLSSQWVWDRDNFRMNFFAHPYEDNLYYNAPRSNGYNFFESSPFVLFGSLMWEYGIENTPPSANDLINTTFDGIFLGEVFYRLSSNILDDRKTGIERFYRELFAGILNPVRAFNRILQGKMGRVTQKEVYQKEPMNIILSAGVHRINENLGFEKGNLSGLITGQLVYGNSFEHRSRKPFDFFEIEFGMNIAPPGLQNSGKSFLDYLTGSGILTGKNSKHGNLELLTGFYQNYDYWNTRHFEIGTIGLGGGLKFRFPDSKKVRFESSVNLNAVPFGASNNVYSAIGERDYSFAGGLEAKTENTLYLDFISLSATYN